MQTVRHPSSVGINNILQLHLRLQEVCLISPKMTVAYELYSDAIIQDAKPLCCMGWVYTLEHDVLMCLVQCIHSASVH